MIPPGYNPGSQEQENWKGEVSLSYISNFQDILSIDTFSQKTNMSGIEVHTSNPSPQETEAGGQPWFPSFPGLHNKFRPGWDTENCRASRLVVWSQTLWGCLALSSHASCPESSCSEPPWWGELFCEHGMTGLREADSQENGRCCPEKMTYLSWIWASDLFSSQKGAS